MLTLKSGRKVTASYQAMALLLLLPMAALSCSGCFPLRFTTSPGASGVVLDSATRAPLMGAEVVISRAVYPPVSIEAAFTNSRLPMVLTKESGEFSIPPEKRWDIYVVPLDIFPHFAMLVVRSEGYQSTVLPFWSRSVKPVGEILLQPVPREPTSTK